MTRFLLFSFISTLLFISCSNSNEHVPENVIETDIIDSSFIIKFKVDSAFLARNMKEIYEIESKEDCNLIVKHYIVKGISKNIDSLKRCAKILTSNLFKTVSGTYTKSCNGINPRAGVFLYTSEKKYRITANFAAYHQNLGKEVDGIFSAYNLK